MSYFFDNHLSLGHEQAICSAWSNTDFNMILAVSTNAPHILFVQEEGNIVPNFEISRGKIKAVSLKWHPIFQALAIGWEDGAITLWNEDERLTREEKVLHKASIAIITFSADGSRMVTGDAKGMVGVWRTHRGLTPVCQYQKEGTITNVVFCSLMLNQENPTGDNTNSLFFFGGTSGSVCLADDLKNCSEVCKVPGSVKTILFYEKENSVIIITSHLLLVQFKLNLSEKLVPDRKVKLAVAGNPEFLSTIWAGQGLLATVSGENMIRMFNIEQDENYVLTLAESAFQGLLFQDKIVSISYNHRRRILSGGTKNGYIVMWKCKQMSAESPSTSEGWDARAPIKAQGGPLTKLEWGGNQQILAAQWSQGITVLNHTILKKKMKDNFKMMQISNKAVEVRLKNESSPNTDYQIIMTLGMNIKGIDCCKNNTLFWNGKFAQIYEVQGQKGPVIAGNFESHATVMALTEDSVIQNEENKIQVCSFTGEVKQVIPMTESEGEVILIDIKGRFMACITQNNMIKIFDISRRQFKQIGVTRKFEIKNGEPLGEIKDIQLNCEGKKLCILADQSPFPSIRIPDTKFYIYDVDMDNFMEMEVGTNRVPTECFWDQSDPRLLCVETEYIKDISKNGFDGNQDIANQEIIGGINADEIENDFKKKEEDFTGKTLETFFVTTDYKVKRQDTVKFEEGDETLLGLHVPFFYFMGRQIDENEEENNQDEEKPVAQNNQSNMIILRRPMKDFIGLENVDEATKKAIMNFSFFLTVGNMDEAYNSVRNIKNNTVWQNMAQMCVKTKRLDVAQVCLGNMRFARGARVVRETEKEREIEARLAMVAIQLNMIDDAKDLYKECGRYDLLCKLHQACGEWDEAIEVSEKYNRINLKNTHFTMAKHFESIGQIDDAIRHYIQSETHKTEVPRMLTALGQFDRLQIFVSSQKEPELYKWWAQYLEAQGIINESLGFYRLANDYGSIVRLLCSNGDIPSAMKLALETNDPQACFHLARHYEQNNMIRDAIVYYSKSQRLHHAIRLAKECGYDQEVMTMSLISSKQIMVQSAAYFEKKGKYDKAVSLYMRGGNKKKAINLAIPHNIPIDDFPSTPTDNDDPETLESSVQFLIQNKQYDKAVEVMIQLGKFQEALEQAEKFNISLKEEFAMKLVPPAPAATDAYKTKERKDICMRLAKLCKKQGDFKLGGKLYTLANEKLKGMKCLLKSGDVKAVIGYAQNARQTEVYVLAGNFLQNQNWHNDPEIMKTIISFYQKAKAFESLANFYDACAQVEIDEYRDYEKALGAMREALRQLEKAANAANREMKLRMLKERIGTIERFVQARESLAAGDHATMVQICNSLVDQPGVEDAIRLGDVFAQLVEYFSQNRQYQNAMQNIDKMRKKIVNITPYLDPSLVEEVYSQMGMPVPGKSKAYNDGIDEDIKEEY